jgi:hypothetical protein
MPLCYAAVQLQHATAHPQCTTGSEGAAGGSDGGAANSQAAIVALLRRAAGVFDHMATNVLPILPVALGPYASKDRCGRGQVQRPEGGCGPATLNSCAWVNRAALG